MRFSIGAWRPNVRKKKDIAFSVSPFHFAFLQIFFNALSHNTICKNFITMIFWVSWNSIGLKSSFDSSHGTVHMVFVIHKIHHLFSRMSNHITFRIIFIFWFFFRKFYYSFYFYMPTWWGLKLSSIYAFLRDIYQIIKKWIWFSPFLFACLH